MTYNHAEDLITEVEWIIGTDSTHSIARRLGYKRTRTLLDRLHHLGRHDLAARLRGTA